MSTEAIARDHCLAPSASTRRSRGGRYRRALRTEPLTPEQVGLAEHG